MFNQSSLRGHQELAKLNRDSLTTLLNASGCSLKSFSRDQVFAGSLARLMKFETVCCVFMDIISQMKHSFQV